MIAYLKRPHFVALLSFLLQDRFWVAFFGNSFSNNPASSGMVYKVGVPHPLSFNSWNTGHTLVSSALCATTSFIE
jgi:hypothetical protein